MTKAGQEETYKELIEWFRKSGAYVPGSKELLPLMKACYSPQDAKLLAGMPLTLTEIDSLSELKSIDPDELSARLDEMAGRGLVFRSKTEKKIKYRPNPPRFVFLRSFFWPGRRDKYTRSVSPLVTHYYLDGFGDHWKEVKTKGLRAIPVNRVIADPRSILPYEDVVRELCKHSLFAVAHCACRHRANTDPNLPDCKHETENCLHFGKLARYIIENKLGRQIGREECEDILQTSAKAGLVHAISNWQDNVDTICNCCKCCCVYFQGFHALGHAGSMNPSNYEVRLSGNKCKACGLCVERCPMGAIELRSCPGARNKEGKAAAPNPGLCIGCGVCANSCPTKSLILFLRPEIVEPPRDVADLKERYSRELAESRAKKKNFDVQDKHCMGDISSGEGIEGIDGSSQGV